jgi:hypothetical protein
MTVTRIAALYQHLNTASRAAQELIQAGIPEEDISVERKRERASRSLPDERPDRGLGDFVLDISEYFGQAHQPGFEQAGTLVIVVAPQPLMTRVREILGRHAPVDTEEHAAALVEEPDGNVLSRIARMPARRAGTAAEGPASGDFSSRVEGATSPVGGKSATAGDAGCREDADRSGRVRSYKGNEQ